MNAYNILIAGFGGQGVLFTGKVMAEAGLIDNREVTWMPTYGPETRGGTSNCSVCISDETIGSPLVTRPNVLIVMNSPSYEKYINTIAPGGKIFLNSSIIPNSRDSGDGVEVYKIPATELSNDQGLEGIANIIILGKVLKETGFTSYETIEKAIQKSVPARKAHLLEHNLRAIKLGMAL